MSTKSTERLDDVRKAMQIAELPWEKKKAKLKAKKENRRRWFGDFWKSEARKVCEERLAHYESTGNEWKASIYRRKLGK
jgi:hypothetical protein